MSFSDALKKQLQQKIRQLELPEIFMQTVQQTLLPLAQHYERITRSCLDGLAAQADVVLKIDDEHSIASMHFNEQQSHV